MPSKAGMSVDKLPNLKKAARRKLTASEPGGRVRKSRESSAARKRISRSSGTTY